MALGYYIDQMSINGRTVNALITLRNAYDVIESFASFIRLHDPEEGSSVDPLVEKFGYTVEEATILRDVFLGLDQARVDNEEIFAKARKITGLE